MKTPSTANKPSAFGPATREKYEEILFNRVNARIATLNKKLEAQRKDASAKYLKSTGLDNKHAEYCRLISELEEATGSSSYGPWLDTPEKLMATTKVRAGVDAVLQNMPSLKPTFAELRRLNALKDSIREKVWLAGAPSEIAAILAEIGEVETEE
ncbi:hypothetical protein GPROT1_01369 [Gammaproteobacteria bacterium]|nr:hypothetical protein GPROT1_01369 [Gammaproteobacteria bacterium]